MPVVFGTKKQEEFGSSGGKLGVCVCGVKGKCVSGGSIFLGLTS